VLNSNVMVENLRYLTLTYTTYRFNWLVCFEMF